SAPMPREAAAGARPKPSGGRPATCARCRARRPPPRGERRGNRALPRGGRLAARPQGGDERLTMSSSNRRKHRQREVKPEVRAAGGLVWRETVLADEHGDTTAAVEFILVHRPRYDDWSFPKGKLDKGETFEAAAVREVAEETGLVCTLGHELPSTEYI